MAKQSLCVSVAAILASLMPLQAGQAADPSTVEFSSAPVPMSAFQQRLARERGETNLFIPGVKLHGYLRKPEEDRPFPAIVFLHGNLGLDEASKTILPESLTNEGYVTLVVDSFSAPGIGINRISPLHAYGALIYLSHLPFVDARRIAIVGSAAGGDAALLIAQPDPQEPFYNPEHLQFRAVVAFTPRCESESAFTVPTLILAAELDQRSPPSGCLRAIELHRADPTHPRIIVYPGVHNGFQVPEFSPGRVVQEYWREYNAETAARATDELRTFLNDILRK